MTMHDWKGGWLQGTRHIPSPNYGERPAQARVTLVVVHSISLPPGEYGQGNVEALFTNRLNWDAHPYFQGIRGLQVSAHFFIDRRGKVTQFVSCDHRAWHAGKSCFAGVENCNDYSIGIELEGLEGCEFTNDQYQSLVAVIDSVSEQYPIDSVQGHEHIAPGRKSDPGKGFVWQRLRQVWPDRAWQLPGDEA